MLKRTKSIRKHKVCQEKNHDDTEAAKGDAEETGKDVEVPGEKAAEVVENVADAVVEVAEGVEQAEDGASDSEEIMLIEEESEEEALSDDPEMEAPPPIEPAGPSKGGDDMGAANEMGQGDHAAERDDVEVSKPELEPEKEENNNSEEKGVSVKAMEEDFEVEGEDAENNSKGTFQDRPIVRLDLSRCDPARTPSPFCPCRSCWRCQQMRRTSSSQIS